MMMMMMKGSLLFYFFIFWGVADSKDEQKVELEADLPILQVKPTQLLSFLALGIIFLFLFSFSFLN